VRKDRYANLQRIRGLDPQTEYLQIYQTMLRYEWPWDLRMGLNLAFNRSFAVPDIAALHVATGELTERTQKRLDDTGLLMYEMILNGFEDGRGREALRSVNRIHRKYDIPSDEYLYVLACLIVIPTRWLNRYGWRRPCCHERTATHHLYQQIGSRMGIDSIPDSYEAVEDWFDAYDAAHLTANENAAAIERATRMLLLTRVPKILAPLGDALVSSLYDDRLRTAVKVDRAPWLVRAGLHTALRTRAWIMRTCAPPRPEPIFADGITTKTYPDGYTIDDLGPASARRPVDDT
jgi:hypothetical protein